MAKTRRTDLTWVQEHQRAYQMDTGELVLTEVSATDCPDPNAIALLVEAWEVDVNGTKVGDPIPGRVVTIPIAAMSQNLVDPDAVIAAELSDAADRVKVHRAGMARLRDLPRKPLPSLPLAAQRRAELP